MKSIEMPEAPEFFGSLKEAEAWWCRVWMPYIEELETQAIVDSICQ